jgi:type I restriction enzyme R subunit
MKHREIAFEEAIALALIGSGGFEKGSAAYDAGLALYPGDVLSFVQTTQVKTWRAITDLYGTSADGILIETLVKELASKTALTVLRHGFKCAGRMFRLAHFRPNTSMNAEALADYQANRLCVYRQVHFSPGNTALSVDVVLALNGLPVVTLELKNPLTGQSVEHAKRQYKERNEREPLFRFKERALVHFAVDPDEAWMATKLAGKETQFLPFNRGDRHGAGNPTAAEGKYKTSYIWDEVLTRDSLMDILARFLHLQVEERQVATAKGIKTNRKESIVFPRYHQLDAVRRLVADARTKGSGHNYLIQHSAGSGKSNSIAWLAHRLASLHDAKDAKVFDTVVVITDRRVLDQQLQNTVYQFEHKQGVVQKIDEDTQQLAKALSGDVPIVISTIQKFPFIAQAINTLEKKGEAAQISTAGRRFAVIVDEAHSSQSGEAASELRRILNKDGIETAIAEQLSDLEGEPLSEEAKKALLAEMLKRPRQPNISYFAFTATPKFKTLAAFNEPGAEGLPPFHLYSMRQAIEEGFIIDVLAHYTTYKTYYGLIKEIAGDPEVPRREAAKALARFMSLHPHNIAQKVEVIVEHFRTFTKHKIGGRAKAMVVTGSRLHAVRYKLAFDKYVKEKGYIGIRSLVAFSGSVNDSDIDDRSYTEVGLNNGIRESELPDKFAGEDYQVLLVAEKYQTGFDQPLLHTMYVDKRLAGVQAVQTLSRLNRIATGKEDTFVLDFVNDPAEIYAAFKPYYEVTSQGEQPDPHQLYDLQHRLFEWQLFDRAEIDALCEVWFKNRYDQTAGDHQKINATVDKAVERYKALDDEEAQDRFKGQLASFRNLYSFLSQIIPYQDSDLEKLYTYARFLLIKLRRDPKDLEYRVEDDVTLKYYRLQQISSGSIGLREGDADPLRGPTEVGTRSAIDDVIALSSLIDQLNERFGTDFQPADQLFFDQVAETALANGTLQAAAKVNKIEDFAYVFNRMLEGLFIERMDGNEEIFKRLMNDDSFRAIAASHLVQEVYNKLRSKPPGEESRKPRGT